MKLVRNWRHLALSLHVDLDVIRRLGQFSDFSPTIRLFEFLATWNPDLTIKELKDILLEIGRNDLISLLITKAGCSDTGKVLDVITFPSNEAPSPTVSLLDEIALALDGTSLVLSNWYTLAIKLGVPRKTCWEFERRSTENPTGRLFQYLAITCPQMTLLSLREALDSMKRNDLIKFLHDEKLGDEMLLKDIITPGSELLERLSQELNREKSPGVKNWTNLAWTMKIPADVCREFADVKQSRKSPTKEVLEWVAAQFPEIALSDVAKALDEIQRNDAIQIISEHFPDTVDSALKGLGCSFKDSFSMPDPTSQMFSTSFEREERDPFPSREVKEQSGHYGSLPDRTDLVGRNETCERIITALSSNKSVEIVAPPGYGKTSVVIEVAYKMIEWKNFVAYIKPRGFTCVEDLASKIIETLGYVPGENTITEVFRRISSFKRKSVVLIIENIDNLLHLEDQVSKNNYHQEFKSENCCTKMWGKFTKNDFLTFLKDLGQSPNIQLVLTSRETYDFYVSFPLELIKLESLNDKDSASMFSKCEDSLDEHLIKDLVRVCGGIPLIICAIISILRRENPQKAARRLSSSSPSSLVKELNSDILPNEDRIDKCLEICFARFGEVNQKIFVMFSTFPYRFTQEQFQAVFRSSITADLQTCLNSLEHSSLLRFDRGSCQYSLHPFIRNFFSLKSDHKEAKLIFIRHYSNLAVTLCGKFLTKDCKSAMDQYRPEKDNIREAMAWCGDDHPELDQTTREQCIGAFNKAATFLAKVMRKQEFQSLFCKLAHRCRSHMELYSACLTNIGMKIVLSCTCTPHICPRALYQAKETLTQADDIQSTLTDIKDTNRAQCLSKLGFCCVREGRVYEGYGHLDIALKLRWDRAERLMKNTDQVMLAACFNDIAASQMVQRNYMVSIQTRLLHVLPVYEEKLGDHPFTATTLNWIGNSYYALGDFDNAIKYNSRSITIRKQLLGQHQETARSLYDLGVAYIAKQDYETALKHLKEAGDLQEEVLDTHDELIHTYQAMSITLRALGRNEEADEAMNRAGACAKKLDSWEAPLDKLRTQERDKGWIDILPAKPRN